MENQAILSALAKIDCQKETKVLFGSIFTKYQFKKKYTLENPKHGKRPIFYLATGILHLHYLENKGKTNSRTLRFFKPGSFFTLPDATSKGLEAFQLTTLTDCSVYVSDYDQVEHLYQTDQEIAKIILELQDQWNLETNQELALLRIPTSDRYRIFFEQMGIYRLHIPQKDLASYLSISSKHLGRLQKDYLTNK